MPTSKVTKKVKGYWKWKIDEFNRLQKKKKLRDHLKKTQGYSGRKKQMLRERKEYLKPTKPLYTLPEKKKRENASDLNWRIHKDDETWNWRPKKLSGKKVTYI